MVKAFQFILNKTSGFALMMVLTCMGGFAQERIVADQDRGCDTLTVSFSLDNARPLADYSGVVWNFGDGNSVSGTLNPQHTYLSPGIFDVRCILDGARIINADAPVVVGATPYADFAFRDTSQDDTEFRYVFEAKYFNPVPGIGLSYFWEFPDGSTRTDSLTIYSFPAADTYQVFLRLEDENGCSDSITRMVPVFRELLVPNVFTPNGDHLNDYFEVDTPGDFIYTCRIFARNGLQVYYSRSPRIIWDGRNTSGNKLPAGVYYYIIESEDTPVETAQAGFIHLFR